MKYLIASDLHGGAEACRMLLERFEKEQADRLLFLGDLLYHGPRNDLPENYGPKAVIPMLNEKKDTILCVRGNCDTEVDQMVLEFPILADYALLSFRDRMIFLTHGHRYNAQALPPLKRGDVLLSGHTHVPLWEEREGILFLNPGSVTIPKNGSCRSYMTLEEGKFFWKNLDTGEVYHALVL